jgi:hypothetical protein
MIDAMGTLQDMGQTIRNQDADEVLALMGHQGTWLADVARLLEWADAPQYRDLGHQTSETPTAGHGREERRRTTVTHDMTGLRGDEHWVGWQTVSSSPSIPCRTRCSWPLYQVPTNPNGWLAFLSTLSSPTHVHSHRRWVAGLLSSTCCHRRVKRDWPRRCTRRIHFCLGLAPSMQLKRFLSQTRRRGNS